MSYCTNCGAELSGVEARCPRCGAITAAGSVNPQSYAAPEIGREAGNVQPYATGGLIAWSIITLLLCTIPGIVALVQTCGINKCTTVPDQEKKIKSAKIWCIVGTVLGVLYLIGAMATAF